MRQDLLDGLVTFVVVAQERNFSAAAVRLGVSASAVSQSISKLEGRLRSPLFNRTTRSVSLTEVGQRYLDRVLPAIHELNHAGKELDEVAEQPAGLLRLNVARSGYMIAIQPVLRAFLEAYPEIRVEVRIDTAMSDIVADGFDAGIRFGETVERDMVAVRVGPPITAHIIASPDYLARRGVPLHPEALHDHDCIGYRNWSTGQVERWEFEKEGVKLALAVGERLILNDSAALVQAALDGIGITYMINGYLERMLDEGRLVRILADWSPPLSGLTVYYSDRRRVPPKLRAFIDFIQRNRHLQEPDTGAVIVEQRA